MDWQAIRRLPSGIRDELQKQVNTIRDLMATHTTNAAKLEINEFRASVVGELLANELKDIELKTLLSILGCMNAELTLSGRKANLNLAEKS